MVKLKNRYANALVELSDENDSLEKDLEQAVLVRDLLSTDDVQAFLGHPNIPDSAKYELFQHVFSEQLTAHFTGFLYLMVRKNRESLIVPALTEFIKRTNRLLGRIEAKIVSARMLTKEQAESIRTVLSKQLNMQVEVTTTVDPDIIGGFYVLVDGRIFDGTIRSELHNMRERLKRGNNEC